MSITETTQVNVQGARQRFRYAQRVTVLDNGDPDDPYTGAAGEIVNFSRWRASMVYEVFLDTLVLGRHSHQFREDELEAVS